MPETTLRDYWYRIWRNNIRHSIPWLRDGVLLGVALVLTPILLAAWLYGIQYLHTLDWKLIKATLLVYAAILIGYVGYHLIRAAWKSDVARQQEIKTLEGAVADKIEEISKLTTPPDLEIRWKPGEMNYFYPYMLPPGSINIQYRICIVNNTDRFFSEVTVKLDTLFPGTLTCVPTELRKMNDNREPYDKVFSLSPNGGYAFIDLLLQWPEGDKFWIFHATEKIDVRVPAMPYSMTIKAQADGLYFAEREFFLEKNNALWNLIAKDQVGSKATRQ